MNGETEGNVPVKEFFERMASKIQILKYQERIERDNYYAYQKELNDPKPDPKKPKRGEHENGKDHYLYLLFATQEIWDTMCNFPEEVLKFFTPEPFSQKQLACAMNDTLKGKLMSCKIHCINSTARAVDPLIPIARDASLDEVMNNYGHRGPDQSHSEHRAMGHGRCKDCSPKHCLPRVQLATAQPELS